MSRGFYAKVTNNEIYDLNLNRSPNFSMDQEELPPERIIMAIRLSDVNKVKPIKTSLAQSLLEYGCTVHGTIITVSGYPPRRDFGTNNILAIAQKHDPRAVENRS